MTEERYVVLRYRDGWTVNIGADIVSLHPSQEAARDAAEKRVEEAQSEGRDAEFLGVLNNHAHLEEDR
ncbi:DUF2188 domain-containing protein [Caulobacter sp. NIBR2454]|uniref:DUF2188 domain-containing protein n=1 Tax=Caulobacter sp. NIBR2454 TaxID=3015996 RepID=UPI0022B6F254|nr:DUF2188 domain-containing protein [Caulobacter sp. NIBR2454]